MKISVKAISITFAILWSGAILLVGICNQLFPDYGRTFLTVLESIYPGYHVDLGVKGVVIGTLYGFIDGGVGGAFFAWLYNKVVTRCG